MKDPQDITACVCDSGLFLHVALRLAESYKQVFYWTPFERTMIKMREGLIGAGYETISRVNSIWPIKDQIDLFVFPDIGLAGMQLELMRQGYPVWGHLGQDKLETNRGLFLEKLQEVGLPVPKFEVAHGFTKLLDLLDDKEDVFIKVSKWRGDWETIHYIDAATSMDELIGRSIRMGPLREHLKFYVFEPIDADVEDGIDTYCINGQTPDLVMHSLENKDKGLITTVQRMDEIAPAVAEVTRKFSTLLNPYRSFFSTEVRIQKDEAFFIDPTLRAASPVSQAMVELYDNFATIIAAGAEGQCIEPEVTDHFGVQALISCERRPDQWTTMTLDPAMQRFVKIAFSCRVGDSITAAPMPELGNMLGWLVATGKTLEEAIRNLNVYREELLPAGFNCDTAAIGSLLVEAQAAKKDGIDYGTLPDPGITIDSP